MSDPQVAALRNVTEILDLVDRMIAGNGQISDTSDSHTDGADEGDEREGDDFLVVGELLDELDLDVIIDADDLVLDADESIEDIL